MSYVGLIVGIHGLADDADVQIIEGIVRRTLEDRFQPQMDSDLDVEVEEHTANLACAEHDDHEVVS